MLFAPAPAMRSASFGILFLGCTLLVVAIACGGESAKPAPLAAPPLVDTAWLKNHADQVVVVDLQKTVADYAKGHFDGAVYAGVEDFRTPDKLLLDVEALTERLGRLGIDADSHVVLCDNRDGYNAAWLWYTLHQLGHRRVSILDGGVGALGSHVVPGSPPAVVMREYVPRKRPSNVVSVDWAVRNLGKAFFLDARIDEQYTGETPKKGFAPGHLPGAINLPYPLFLNPDHTFVSAAKARQIAAHLPRDQDLVLYCNTYQAAALVQFHLFRAGFSRILAFDGSILAYAKDRSRPLVTGTDP